MVIFSGSLCVTSGVTSEAKLCFLRVKKIYKKCINKLLLGEKRQICLLTALQQNTRYCVYMTLCCFITQSIQASRKAFPRKDIMVYMAGSKFYRCANH